MLGLAAKAPGSKTLSINAISREIGRTKRGLDTKLQTLTRLAGYLGLDDCRAVIEIKFRCLKDWRRAATSMTGVQRFLPAIALAATVLFWL